MIDTVVHAIDVDAAIGRAEECWGDSVSLVEVEAAFTDRTLLAQEVIRLRAELAETIDSLAESDLEIARLQQTIERLVEIYPIDD